MRPFFRFLAISLLALGGFWPSFLLAAESSAHSAAASFPNPDLALLREALRASGVADVEKRQSYETAFQTLLDDLARQLGTARSPYRRARRLHLTLHQHLFRRYESTADGLDAVLDRGEYNCLSASLLYGLLARAFGLEVQVVEIPRHVYVRLFIDQRRIEVESTSRTGFDLRPKPVLGPETLPDPGYGANAGGVG